MERIEANPAGQKIRHRAALRQTFRGSALRVLCHRCVASSAAKPGAVDDIITKGRTLLAAAARLHEAFPAANVRAFALLRTKGLVPEVNRLLEPCKGSIRWRAGDARREP